MTTSIEDVPKISRKIIPALKRLNIKTIRDLLLHFPSRYEDFSNQKLIRDIISHETVTIRGVIKKISAIRTARKKMYLTEASIEDESGTVKVLWFNLPFLVRILRVGNMVSVSGKATVGRGGLYLQNPSYERILAGSTSHRKYDSFDTLHTGGLVPIYPETEGITSRWLRYLIKIFIGLRKTSVDPLPSALRDTYHLPDIVWAIEAIHFPKMIEDAERARQRFAFENLLLIQLRAFKERSLLKQHRAPEIPLDIPLIKQFVAHLPFSLTTAQRRSMWEIFQDIAKPQPMNRLLEGDVGSGKTVVAAASALLTVQAGFEVAFMAPTEILARQHFGTLQNVLTPFGISIGLLTGAEKKNPDDAKIIVGTHALIQKNVQFAHLGLVIIDEQHRFGVEQRSRILRSADRLPHFLSMSATPIPRTLALTIYGDLDLSILDEMPKNRKEIITKIVEPHEREDAYQFIRKEVEKDRQVFVVCPRIETPTFDSRSLRLGPGIQQRLLTAEVKTVKEEYKKLSEIIFPDLRVAMLHGKMKSREKEEIMRAFKNGEFDILVSTSVIEVGVDIPNATIMMIEGAERFGLAQLHQFRGRVGRGTDQSYCLLFPTEDSAVSRRLRAVVDAKNGFALAQKDMEIRGVGDMFGSRQWGISDIAFDALSDAKLVREVRAAAAAIIKESPDLRMFPALSSEIAAFEKRVHLE